MPDDRFTEDAELWGAVQARDKMVRETICIGPDYQLSVVRMVDRVFVWEPRPSWWRRLRAKIQRDTGPAALEQTTGLKVDIDAIELFRGGPPGWFPIAFRGEPAKHFCSPGCGIAYLSTQHHKPSHAAGATETEKP